MQLGEVVNIFTKNKKKFVTVFLAEGNTKDSNGVGIADEYLEEFGKQYVADKIGHTAIAFPTAGHPKYYPAPSELLQSGNTMAIGQWYRKQALPYRIGTYIHTFVKKIKETGKRRLLGTYVIEDPKYQKLWDMKKYPRWNSSSIYEVSKNKDGFITKAIPVDNCSVNTPHYGTQLAGVYHVCDGEQSECIAKSEAVLKQSGQMLCTLCKDKSADLFTNFYDPNNQLIELGEILQSGESYLTDENTSGAPAETSTGLPENKTLPDSTQSEIDAAKNKEALEKEETKPEERDWKAYALELETKMKTSSDELKDKFVPKAAFEKITKELRYNKVNAALNELRKQLPDIFKDEEEFTKKVNYFNNLKMTDEEVLQHITETVNMYSPLIKENRKLKQSGNMTPYGIDVDEITSSLKTSGNSSDDNKNKPILVGEL